MRDIPSAIDIPIAIYTRPTHRFLVSTVMENEVTDNGGVFIMKARSPEILKRRVFKRIRLNERAAEAEKQANEKAAIAAEANRRSEREINRSIKYKRRFLFTVLFFLVFILALSFQVNIRDIVINIVAAAVCAGIAYVIRPFLLLRQKE